ncbi:MAG: glycosyltransferase family 87 protein [Terracidiphilus sp.]
MKAQKTHIHLDAGLFIAMAVALAGYVVIHRPNVARCDFGNFYFAARMVLDGARHALYDLDTQRIFQARFHPGTTLPFRNPPFALLPILCLAKLPELTAYTIWIAASFALLYQSFKVLAVETGVFFENWPILLTLLYMPLISCMLHGQYSCVVLACYVLAYAQWKKGRAFVGGAILSIATLKFQLVLGMVAVLVLRRKWREIAGFVSGCAVLLIISAWITGVRELLAYPNFLLHNELGLADEFSTMANWKGLLTICGAYSVPLELTLSVATILWAAWVWKDLDRGFAAAVLAAMLVSHHLTVSDLTLTILPVYLGVKAVALPRRFIIGIALFLCFLPWALAFMHAPFALLGIPSIVALCWLGRGATRTAALPEEPSADQLSAVH